MSAGLQGGFRAGLTKLLGARIEVNFGSKETSLITGHTGAREAYAIGLELFGFSFGYSIERSRRRIRPGTSIHKSLRHKDFDGGFYFDNGYTSHDPSDFWKIEFGAAALLGAGGTLDFSDGLSDEDCGR